MRDISAQLITDTVEKLFLDCAYCVGKDVESALKAGLEAEPSPIGRETLRQILQSDEIASTQRVALCQDTGMAVVFMELGQDAHVTSGDLNAAVNEGVRRAYETGYLRKSVVRDPLYDRVNTGDNTPAVLHLRIVPGEGIRILVTAKGFGSENMSRVKMLTPADGEEGVKAFIVETAVLAGPNPCPPIILGVGIGGTFEQAALMAKRCTARPLDSHHPDPRYHALEDECLRLINKTGIGPGGTGGRTTALKVNIDSAPTHIAGLPVAVNVCCHAARHAEVII